MSRATWCCWPRHWVTGPWRGRSSSWRSCSGFASSRPRRSALRYGGWLLATFAGAASLAGRRRGGASNFLEQGGGSHSHRAGGPRTNGPSNRFPILVRPSADILPAGIGRGQGGSPGRSGRVYLPLRSRRAALVQRRTTPKALGRSLAHDRPGNLGGRVSDLRRTVVLVRPAHPVAAGRARTYHTRGARNRAGVGASRCGSGGTSGSALTRRSPRQCASVCCVRSSSGRRRRTAR